MEMPTFSTALYRFMPPTQLMQSCGAAKWGPSCYRRGKLGYSLMGHVAMHTIVTSLQPMDMLAQTSKALRGRMQV